MAAASQADRAAVSLRPRIVVTSAPTLPAAAAALPFPERPAAPLALMQASPELDPVPAAYSAYRSGYHGSSSFI